MVKNNEETSLVKIDNSIFGKMKRFWNNLFFRKNKNYEDYEVVEEKSNTNNYKQRDSFSSVQEAKKPKLFNFDDPENDMSGVPIRDEVETNEGGMAGNEEYANIFNSNNQAGVEKYFDEDEQNNDFEAGEDSANDEDSDEYEVKDEIQEKLMNYYASIKNSIKQ